MLAGLFNTDPRYIAQRICLLESQQSQLNREVVGDVLFQKWDRYVLNRTTESGMSLELYLYRSVICVKYSKLA